MKFTIFVNNRVNDKVELTGEDIQQRFEKWLMEKSKTKAGRQWLSDMGKGLNNLFIFFMFLTSRKGLNTIHKPSKEDELIELLNHTKRKVYKQIFADNE